MSFLPITACRSETQPPHEREILSCEAKMALITDVVLATFTVLIATAAILTAHGLINLGPLNALHSLGTQTASIMLGAAGGVVLVDIVALIVKMVKHISQLKQAGTEIQDQERSALRAENETLKLQNATLQLSAGQLPKLQAEHTTLEQKIKTLEDESGAAQVALKKVRAETAALSQQHQEMSQKVLGLHDIELRNEAELKKAQEEIGEKRKEAAGILAKAQEDAAALIETQEKVRSLHEELEGLQAAKARLQDEIAQLTPLAPQTPQHHVRIRSQSDSSLRSRLPPIPESPLAAFSSPSLEEVASTPKPRLTQNATYWFENYNLLKLNFKQINDQQRDAILKTTGMATDALAELVTQLSIAIMPGGAQSQQTTDLISALTGYLTQIRESQDPQLPSLDRLFAVTKKGQAPFKQSRSLFSTKQ